MIPLGADVWIFVVYGDKFLAAPLTNSYEKKAFVNTTKAMNLILFGLVDSEFVKVMECDST